MLNEYTELLRVLNLSENWQDEMEQRHIKVIFGDGDLILLKYNLIESDFNDPVVRACRGVILTRLSGTYGEWKIICAPFLKFSYGNEQWERPIDWKTAKVREKIDGSLIKLFYYRGYWRIASNSTTDATKAFVRDYDITFADLFSKAVGENWESWANKYLDCSYTYMFELVAPENRVVISYDKPKAWYLGRRNMFTLEEDDEDIEDLERPQLYDLNNLEDVLSVVKSMENQEGVVVYDKDFNRVKIKSQYYLTNHFLANNGDLSYRHIIEMIKDNSIDDYLAYFGDSNGRIKEVQDKLLQKATELEHEWNMASKLKFEDRHSFADYVYEYFPKSADYIFLRYDGHNLSGFEYLIKCPKNKLIKIMRGVRTW